MAETRLLPEVNEPFAKIWCNTMVEKMGTICYTWAINDFTLYPDKTGEVVTSSTFSAGTNDNLKWNLQLYPGGVNSSYRDDVSLFIQLVSCKKSQVRAKIEMRILNSTKKVEVVHVAQGVRIGWCDFIRRDTLLAEANGLLPKDILTIICEIGILGDIVNICHQSENLQFNVRESKLIQDFGNMLDNGKFSDITLAVGEREFQAHKAILAARSDVFAAMFSYEMEESQSNRVALTDIGHDVLQEILHFIYTSKAPNLDQMAHDLLKAADKYALETLKLMCEEALIGNISIETAVETLKFADRHSANQLKAYAKNFITANITEVMKTEGGKNLF